MLAVSLIFRSSGYSYNLTDWIISNVSFPSVTQNPILVYDEMTHDIWIIGGYQTRDKLYKYNVNNHILQDMTPLINPNGSIDFTYNYCNNMNALLINRTIYYSGDTAVHSINLETLQYIYMFSANADYCLVTDTQQSKLYLSAHWLGTKFFMWDFSTTSKIDGPDTNENHRGGVCHVSNNILYVLAGELSQTIEYIDLNKVNDNISNARWNNIQNVTFPKTIYSGASVLIDHFIFIFGGAQPSSDDIYIFNTETNVLSNGGLLPSIVRHSPSICVDYRVYIFMGLWSISGGLTNQFMYADILTPEPTNLPTLSTIQPSIGPSMYPTQQPSIQPTSSVPTEQPSIYPTIGPTYVSTSFPSSSTTHTNMYPTVSSNIDSSSNLFHSSLSLENNGFVNGNDLFTMVNIIIVASSLCVVIIIIGVIVITINRKRKTKKTETSIIRVELNKHIQTGAPTKTDNPIKTGNNVEPNETITPGIMDNVDQMGQLQPISLISEGGEHMYGEDNEDMYSQDDEDMYITQNCSTDFGATIGYNGDV